MNSVMSDGATDDKSTKDECLTSSHACTNALVGSRCLSDNTEVYSETKAKELFKELRKRDFVVDLGRCTGNIYTAERRKKLTWMTKDFQNNWIIEML